MTKAENNPLRYLNRNTMDPDEALKRCLGAAQAIIEGQEDPDLDIRDLADLIDGFAEHFLALHQWLQKDGYPPHEWRSDELDCHRCSKDV